MKNTTKNIVSKLQHSEESVNQVNNENLLNTRLEGVDSKVLTWSKENIYFHFLILLLLGFITYINSFYGPFIYDDLPAIVNNKSIHSLTNLKEILNPLSNTPLAGRPIVSLSLALNYYFSELNVFGYHITNFSIHIFCSFILYGIISQTIRLKIISKNLEKLTRERNFFDINNNTHLIAFIIASIWLIHPLNSECVCYITQRTESLMSLWYLLTILFTLYSVNCYNPLQKTTDYKTKNSSLSERSPENLKGASPACKKWMFLAVCSSFLGLFCKENIMTAPFLSMLLILIVTDGYLKDKFRIYYPLFIGFIFAWCSVIFIVFQSPRGGSVGFSLGVSSLKYFINQINIICHYIKLTIIPFPLNIDYGIPVDYTLSETIIPLFILLFLFTLIPIFWKKNILISYLILSFFVILSPTSSFIPIATEVGAERRMYLALIPIIILLFISFLYLGNKIKLSSKIYIMIFIAIIIAFSSMTYIRTLDYQDELRVWHNSTVVLPKNKRSWNSCGVILLERKQFDQAELALNNSLKLDPNYKNALINLGVLKYKTHKYKDAIQYFKQGLKVDHKNLSLYMNIGAAFSALNDIEGIKYYKKGREIFPSNYMLPFNMAILYMKQNRVIYAEKYFLQALKLSDNKSSILAGVGEFYCKNKNIKKGLYYLKKAQKQEPNNLKIKKLIQRVNFPHFFNPK